TDNTRPGVTAMTSGHSSERRKPEDRHPRALWTGCISPAHPWADSAPTLLPGDDLATIALLRRRDYRPYPQAQHQLCWSFGSRGISGAKRLFSCVAPVAGSSNGKTLGSGPSNRGSNPCPAAPESPAERGFRRSGAGAVSAV